MSFSSRTRRIATSIATSIATIAPLALAAAALPTRARAQTYGSAVLSPRVAAAYVVGVRPDSAGDDRRPLIAVVLWRGQTGWISGPARGVQPRKNIRENTARLVRVGDAMEHRQWVGGHDLRFRFDAARQTVEVLGQSVPVKGPTVILVDRMDSAGGDPAVVDVIPFAEVLYEPRLQQSTRPGEWSKLPAEVLRGDLERQAKLRDFLK